MPSRPLAARLAAATLTLAAAAGLAATAAPAASAASCSDVDVVFARGTGERAGLGSVGTPFANGVRSGLPAKSVSTYAVDYAANTSQSSAAPGSTDMTNHITSVAASCPGTRFVIGGYSQGATVTDKAIGIRTGSGSATVIPAALAPRVAAVVVFGNPLGLQRTTIAKQSPTYGPKAKEYCNQGDPVCGNGRDTSAHLTYASNGSAADGARFAVGKIGG